jgi:hypothetical protein
MRRYTRKITPKSLAYAGLLAACASGLGFIGFQSYGKATADAHGCFYEAPQPQSFVLVDASEPRFNDEQAQSLPIYFDRLYETLGFNERLSFVTTEADQVASVARLHVRGQATDPAQLEAIGAASAQAGYLKKQQRRLYEKIVAPEFEALLSADPGEKRRQLYQSSILEMIADLSRLPDAKPGSRIIIVSDLIQNSDSAQFCRTRNEYQVRQAPCLHGAPHLDFPSARPADPRRGAATLARARYVFGRPGRAAREHLSIGIRGDVPGLAEHADRHRSQPGHPPRPGKRTSKKS